MPAISQIPQKKMGEASERASKQTHLIPSPPTRTHVSTSVRPSIRPSVILQTNPTQPPQCLKPHTTTPNHPKPPSFHTSKQEKNALKLHCSILAIRKFHYIDINIKAIAHATLLRERGKSRGRGRGRWIGGTMEVICRDPRSVAYLTVT